MESIYKETEIDEVIVVDNISQYQLCSACFFLYSTSVVVVDALFVQEDIESRKFEYFSLQFQSIINLPQNNEKKKRRKKENRIFFNIDCLTTTTIPTKFNE